MRIVDKSKKIPELSTLGIEGQNYDLIMKAISLPNGIILTSGPTGSGKSTTLYSAMTVLNEPGVNLMTLEDPVENQIDGLNQSQVKPDI
jgi:type IV pilus assembly protein PilB